MHFKNWLSKLLYKLRKPAKLLCTVSFIYKAKGVIGGGNNKTETMFLWVEDGATNKDCVKHFNPPGIGKAQCVITDIIILPIQTVHKQ